MVRTRGTEPSSAPARPPSPGQRPGLNATADAGRRRRVCHYSPVAARLTERGVRRGGAAADAVVSDAPQRRRAGARRGARGAAGLFPPQEQAASATRSACAWAERDGGRGRAVADAVIGARNRRRAGARRGERGAAGLFPPQEQAASATRIACAGAERDGGRGRAVADAVFGACNRRRAPRRAWRGGVVPAARASRQRDANRVRLGRARRRAWSRRRRRSNRCSQSAARGRAPRRACERGAAGLFPPQEQTTSATRIACAGAERDGGCSHGRAAADAVISDARQRRRAGARRGERGAAGLFPPQEQAPARRGWRALGPSATAVAGMVAPSPTQ